MWSCDTCKWIRAFRPNKTESILSTNDRGGGPVSVKFCQRSGLSYVSGPPYRGPVARLAAAQAAIGEKRKAAAPKAKKK